MASHLESVLKRRKTLTTFFLLVLALWQPLQLKAQETLRQVVVLSRHGIRTIPQTGNADHAKAAWPTWVQPAYFLTPNGQLGMQAVGMGYWQRYKQSLFHNAQQPSLANVYVWADNDERTVQTAKSLMTGFAQDTKIPVHLLLSGKADPLFHPLKGEAADFPAPGSLPDFPPTVSGQAADAITVTINATNPSTSSQLKSILEKLGDKNSEVEFNSLEKALGCSPGCVSSEPLAIKSEADGSASMGGALATASTVSEAFMLEYGDGWQPNDIAWGNWGSDMATIRKELQKVLELHVDAYKLVQRNPVGASMQASNLANEIVQIFNRRAHLSTRCPQGRGPCTPCPQQVAEGQEICPPDSADLIFVVGHDTNIGTLGGMLGLDWDLEEAELPPDDMPPGGALIFELWENPTSPTHWVVRAYFITMKLEAYPNPKGCFANPMTCLGVYPVTLPRECNGSGATNSCPLPQFQTVVQERSNRYYTFKNWSASSHGKQSGSKK